MPSWNHAHVMSSLLSFALLPGCGAKSDPKTEATVELPEDADPEVQKALSAGLTKIVNAVSIRHTPLDYNYNEDLLAQIDAVEAYLAGGTQTKPPRSMPRLDEQEELDHLRETIHRWETARGKKLRPTIDALKAEVAARKPGGPVTHPEFHKRFSETFDDFIKFEAAHMRELRNLAIHEQAASLFQPYREKHPELVRYFEFNLESQYPLPKSSAVTDPGSDATPAPAP